MTSKKVYVRPNNILSVLANFVKREKPVYPQRKRIKVTKSSLIRDIQMVAKKKNLQKNIKVSSLQAMRVKDLKLLLEQCESSIAMPEEMKNKEPEDLAEKDVGTDDEESTDRGESTEYETDEEYEYEEENTEII